MDTPAPDLATDLHAIADRLQTAAQGGPALDALVAAALEPTAAAAWSTDPGAALRLLPENHNYSLGRRDGICWAWSAPNDAWEPGDHEMRQDHPFGSGLIVAQTPALALACVAVIVRSKLQGFCRPLPGEDQGLCPP